MYYDSEILIPCTGFITRDVEALLIAPCESRCVRFEGTDNIIQLLELVKDVLLQFVDSMRQTALTRSHLAEQLAIVFSPPDVVCASIFLVTSVQNDDLNFIPLPAFALCLVM